MRRVALAGPRKVGPGRGTTLDTGCERGRIVTGSRGAGAVVARAGGAKGTGKATRSSWGRAGFR